MTFQVFHDPYEPCKEVGFINIAIFILSPSDTDLYHNNDALVFLSMLISLVGDKGVVIFNHSYLELPIYWNLRAVARSQIFVSV